jgi:hypothetical protein
MITHVGRDAKGSAVVELANSEARSREIRRVQLENATQSMSYGQNGRTDETTLTSRLLATLRSRYQMWSEIPEPPHTDAVLVASSRRKARIVCGETRNTNTNTIGAWFKNEQTISRQSH